MKILEAAKQFIRENARIRYRIKQVLSGIFTLFPIQRDKVVMDNFTGKGYGDNPKFIAEELRRRGGFRIIWLCNNLSEQFPENVQAIKRYSLRSFYEMATAKAWVVNTRIGKLTNKRKQ